LDRFQENVTEVSSNIYISCEMWDDLAGKLELPPSITFKEYVSIDEEEETIDIMDDAAIVESVTSPLEEENDDEPEPGHVLPEEAFRCVEKLKIYIEKMENVAQNIFKMTDDAEHFAQKGMLTKLKQRKIEDFFSVR
jgi:hypothetical protein